MMKDLIVAVDLGGTNIRAALCDAQGKILAQVARPTLAYEGPERVSARILQSLREAVADWSRVRGIGLGAPGPLDPWRGVILEAPNLPGMANFPMKKTLESEFQVPAFVGNDANLGALGEHRYGAGRGVAHMVYITISTGIGGGIIVDNKLALGWRGFAGEVGHQTLEARGPRCNCGNVGCLEALASGPAIARAAREALTAGRASRMRALAHDDPSQVTGALVTQAAALGDELALEILKQAGVYIGLGIVNLLHILDTELFVLGGGVAVNAWEFLYPSVVTTFNQNAMASMKRGVKIVRAELGDNVGLMGAAALVLHQAGA